VEAGKIIDIRGEAWVQVSQTSLRTPAVNGMVIREGDTIGTGPGGRLFVLLSDESLIQINSQTVFVVTRTAQNAGWLENRPVVKAAAQTAGSFYRLITGEVWLRNKNKHLMIDIETSTVVVGVRGTELNLRADGSASSVLTVLRGQVLAANAISRIPVRAGQQVTAVLGQPLQSTMLVSPENAVQWTLTVPVALFDPVFINEKTAAASADDIHFQVAASASKLQSGLITESYEDFTEITQKYPRHAAGFHFLALSALLMGKTDEALAASRQSTRLAPQDVNGYILLSDALQAAFRLQEALQAAQEALRLNGRHLGALLLTARLQFGMDDRDAARKTLSQARAVTPDSGEVANLEGFMLLAGQKTDEAAAAFEKAVSLAPHLGEPHLGLALCHMRKGRPEAAMAEMSAAVLLEPRRSLFVSYWAKMLYELKRFDEALDMLAFAKGLDPRDPTPYLYEGIIYRDMNRPVEAVAALHQAISLNDNRGVYRSRFLLDQDLAVKNINLFILYEKLGLSAWAQSKALRSIKQDYTNFAGHLFYGSALINSGDRTIAGGTELLLGRMLQPANFNSLSSFNAYTSFFDGPAVNGNLGGYTGNNDTRGYNAGVYGGVPDYRLAFLANTYYNTTEGWREGLDAKGSGVATVVKFDPTMNDHLTFSYRELEGKQKDETTGRNEYDQEPNPVDTSQTDTGKVELGYHHHFSPSADFLFFFTWNQDDGSMFDYDRIENIFDLEGVTLHAFSLMEYQRPYTQFQAQQLFRKGNHQLIAGGLHYSGHKDTTIETEDYYYYEGEELDFIPGFSSHDPDHLLTSAYLADIWRIHPRWVVEAALYYDEMTNSNAAAGTEWDLHEVNPRLGLIWEASPSDTFRLAGFRYLLPFTANRIDPTEIAGIPIFRNTGEGSLAKEADMVWEHEWRNAFFSAGIFYLERESESRLVDGEQTVMDTDNGRLKGAEFAVNRILAPGLAMTAGYRFQEIFDEYMPDKDRDDHLASVGLNWVYPCGFSFGLSQSFRYEDFDRNTRQNEEIWLTDVGISYEFPEKRGLASLGIKNIFNNHFNWVEDIFVFRSRSPAREVAGSLSVYF
jgi:tetratricopeptide (TPR) repeat protein